MRLDALLHFKGGAATAQASTVATAPTPVSKPIRFPLIRLAVATAAILVIGLCAFGWSKRGIEIEVVGASGVPAGEWVTGRKVHCSSSTRCTCVSRLGR